MTDRYAILTFNQYIQADGYLVEFTTNTPCHLWLRCSYRKPVVHMEPVLRRGIQMHCNPRFCFVAWQEIEQYQAGDTLIHSFDLHLKIDRKNVWFYSVGEIGGVQSPSTSPIMHLPLDYEHARVMQYQLGYDYMAETCSFNIPYAMTFTFIGHWPLAAVQVKSMAGYFPRTATLKILDTTGDPPTPNNTLAATTLLITPNKLKRPIMMEFTFPIVPLNLSWGEMYAIAIFGDPAFPDQPVFTWSHRPHPGLRPEERTWRVNPLLPPPGWELITGWVHDYHLWTDVPFYQPGIPTPEQIYLK